MATYLTLPCPRCNGYLGIVLREPGRNTPLRAVNGHCLKCGHRLAWIVIKGSSLLVRSHERSDMLNPQKALEREAMLTRIRELDAEIAQLERHIRASKMSVTCPECNFKLSRGLLGNG
jgi:hypothetical protein